MTDLPAIVIRIEAGFGHGMLLSSGHPLHPLPTTGSSSSSSGTVVLPDNGYAERSDGLKGVFDDSELRGIDGLNDYFEGVRKVCADCKGKGKVELLTRVVPCSVCGGSGKVIVK
jgi:hypothetical protein